jgi:hypothetical protein
MKAITNIKLQILHGKLRGFLHIASAIKSNQDLTSNKKRNVPYGHTTRYSTQQLIISTDYYIKSRVYQQREVINAKHVV